MSQEAVYTFPVAFEDIPARGREAEIAFPQGALPGVAERLQVEAVRELKARFILSRRGSLIQVSGTVEGVVERICVASLEPMDERVEDAFGFEMEIVDEMPDLAAELEVDLDAPEPVAGEALDLADLAVQQLSLAMEPFPRKEGAEPVRDEGEQPSLSPFAVLKQAQEE